MTPSRRTPVVGEGALVVRFMPVIRYLARGYSWPGASKDDVLQEAMIGALGGIRTYRPDRGRSFNSFVVFATRRHLFTCIRLANGQKYALLNTSLREAENDDGDLGPILELLDDPTADVHRQLVARLELRETIDRLPLLTDAEQRAVVGFALGASYRELNLRDTDDKAAVGSVDNAYARGRRKLRDAA